MAETNKLHRLVKKSSSNTMLIIGLDSDIDPAHR
jgi:hypothetical protein